MKGVHLGTEGREEAEALGRGCGLDEDLPENIDGGFNFRFVDAIRVATAVEAMDGERAEVFRMGQGFHLAHAMESVLIEMLVGK